MLLRLFSFILSIAISIAIILLPNFIVIANDARGFIIVLVFLIYSINAIIYRSFAAVRTAYSSGSVGDKVLYDLYRGFFPFLYFVLIIFLPGFVALYDEHSLLIKGGFTITSFFEVILLIVLLFLALISYTRCVASARVGQSDFIVASVKSAMSLFSLYGLVLILPFCSLRSFEVILKTFLHPTVYFNEYNIIDIFLYDKNSVYITVSKLLLLLLANFQLHLVKKYYINFYINHSYFVISIILLWSNLYILSMDNIFYTIAAFDMLTMVTVAYVVLHEKPNESTHTSAALNYLYLSVFTSVCAYYGSYFLYSQYHSFSFRFHFLFFESGDVSLPNGFVVLAWFFIGIKLVFLLGTFPFYKYVVDINSIITFPAIFYWSVVSKLAVVVNIVKFLCVVEFINKQFFNYFWIVILSVSMLFASVALCHSPRLKVFFAFSSLVNISTTILFATLDWRSSVFVVLLSFLIYVFAMFGLTLFLSCPRKLTPYANIRAGSEVDVFENLAWSSQEIVFSGALNCPGMQKDIFSAFVKGGAGICALVLMGVAPFSGFLMKFLIVSAFSSFISSLVCVVLLVSAVFTHLGYFALFNSITEKVVGYTRYSYNEWVLYVDEDDLFYFQLIAVFNVYSIIFCLTLIF
jgi:formate hydrogenlyase subunit 3/multisubunit Na+/H+ antiporter MnhD subunit